MQTETNETPQLIVATDHDANKRLDAFLAEKIQDWSRSRLQKLIDNGDVLVNQKKAKSSYKISENDEIEVEFTTDLVEKFEPEDIPLDIIFEDDDLAVINKQAGLVVHPGAGTAKGTLANAIAFHFQIQNSKLELENRAGIVHRLDKDTSGLIVVAKNEITHEKLSDQFQKREVFKSYLALGHGEIKTDKGTIDQPIARDRRNRLRMAIDAKGRNALSLWRVREHYENFTLFEVQIKTGRTHQIRVHLASIKHPVVGDTIYNGGRDTNLQNATIMKAIAGLGRFFLHAEKLAFKHPRSGEFMKFESELPSELSNFLAILKKR
jgi:23S rRNA pseudouridine1911/1915/1917 synthase